MAALSEPWSVGQISEQPACLSRQQPAGLREPQSAAGQQSDQRAWGSRSWRAWQMSSSWLWSGRRAWLWSGQQAWWRSHLWILIHRNRFRMMLIGYGFRIWTSQSGIPFHSLPDGNDVGIHKLCHQICAVWNNLPCPRECGSACHKIGSHRSRSRRLGTYGFIHRAVSNLTYSEYWDWYRSWIWLGNVYIGWTGHGARLWDDGHFVWCLAISGDNNWPLTGMWYVDLGLSAISGGDWTLDLLTLGYDGQRPEIIRHFANGECRFNYLPQQLRKSWTYNSRSRPF